MMNHDMTVLYVEDDARSRKVMRLLLTQTMGLANVFIFENSADFVVRLEELEPKPDIIFLDIHVQPRNGFEMLEMLRRHPAFQQTPVAALTASVMNEEIQRLRTAGFNACFAKPIDIDTFPESVERILGGEEMWHIAG